MGKVKLNITGLSYSQNHTDAYALLLVEENGKQRGLPVVIGKSEAQVIAIYLEKIDSPRPLTHDLIKVITETLEGNIVEVNITKLVEGVFHAEICMVKGTHVFRVDARVSDAVAIALRFDAPIYATAEVMELGSFKVQEQQEEDDEVSGLEDTFSRSDFGEYSLKQIKMMMNEAVRDENYERAARLKEELERRERN